MTHAALPPEPVPEPEPLPVPLLEEPVGDDELLPAGPLPVPAALVGLLVADGPADFGDFEPAAEGEGVGMLAVAGGRLTAAPAAADAAAPAAWPPLASGCTVPHAASDAIARTPATIGSQRRGDPTAAQYWLPNPLPASHQFWDI